MRIFRKLAQLLDVDLTSTPPADGDALTYDSGASKWVPRAGGGGGGAPTDVDYLVGTASGDLSDEIVVGTSPGGELGGTWASPTVDATHSGSSHASVQAAAEATAAGALSAHASDTTGIHGIADTSALATTAASDAAYQPKDTDLTAIAGLSPSNDDVIQRKAGAWTNRTIAQLLVDLAAAGTTFQPLDSDLTALAGLAVAADTLPYGSGSHTMALATFTSFARSLLDDADAAAGRATLVAAPAAAKYIVQTADSELSAEQALGALATGILKNTTTTGVLSIATAGTDYYNPGGTDVALADGGTGASLSDPNADRIMFWDDSAGAVTWLTPGTGLTITDTTIDASSSGSGLYTAHAYLREEQTQNTQGGTPATAGTFGTRVLNTEVFDPGGIVSLSSNQFTLAAGTYTVEARAPFYQAGRVALRLRNVTDSSTVTNGPSIFATDGGNDEAHAFLLARFTIAGSKAFELQYVVGSTGGGSRGLGVEANYSGITEVYAEVHIYKES